VAHGFTILAKDCKNLYESLNSSWISCLRYHPLLANVMKKKRINVLFGWKVK